MIRLLAPAILLMAACQPMPETAPAMTAEGCDLIVSFGSKCCGIDQDAKTKISAFLADDDRVVDVSERRWGREGEVDLCVAIRDQMAFSEFSDFFTQLNGLIPADTQDGSRGPVSLFVIGEDSE